MDKRCLDRASRQEENRKTTEKIYGCVVKDMKSVGMTGEDARDRLRWRQVRPLKRAAERRRRRIIIVIL